MTATASTDMLALPPAAEPRRPRVLLVGSALVAGAWAMALLSLIAVYAGARADVLARGGVWLPEKTVIPLTPGTMGLFTLLMSAVTLQWAVYALRNMDRVHAYVALGVTILLGVAFINGTAYLYTQMGLGVADSPQAVLIYVITGLHLAMVVGGLAFAAAMGFQALGGQLTGRAAEGMGAAALFWHVTVGLYGVVWYAIYIAK
jgi:heme/copper-type cytochrome/quinol oxidase subunit 3